MLRHHLVKTQRFFWGVTTLLLWLSPILSQTFGDDKPPNNVFPALKLETPLTMKASSVAIGDASSNSLSGESFEVLCYHRFVLKPDDNVNWARSGYQLPVTEFQWQMQYLKENGFNPISETQLMDFWFRGKPLPLKPVLITFDDGFRTVFRDAFPILKTYDYPSVFFLYTKFIENGNYTLRIRRESKTKHNVKLGIQPLEIEDIHTMQNSGMDIESHTANHLNLGYVEEKTPLRDYKSLLEFELSEPLTYIQSQFNRKPDMIAYPYGVYDPSILNKTRDLGYKLAFTVNPGPNDRTIDPLKLKRDLILYPISHERFAKLFRDQVLHLTELSPADGTVIDSQRPVIRAKILDDIVPQSIRLQLGAHVMGIHYNSKTRFLTHRVGAELTSGGHILTLKATDIKGFSRVYNWYFRIKHKKLENVETEKMIGVEDAKN